jgi:hypothetical protein
MVGFCFAESDAVWVADFGEVFDSVASDVGEELVGEVGVVYEDRRVDRVDDEGLKKGTG